MARRACNANPSLTFPRSTSASTATPAGSATFMLFATRPMAPMKQADQPAPNSCSGLVPTPAEPGRDSLMSRRPSELRAVPSRPPSVRVLPVYSANLAFGKAYKPILDKLGLTYTQYITVIALWEEGNQTVGSLAEKLFLESNTLTPMLKKLEEMGYVVRQRDTRDERQVFVSLTEAGRKLREKGFSMNLLEATGLDPQQFREIQSAVATLRDNLVQSTRARG